MRNDRGWISMGVLFKDMVAPKICSSCPMALRDVVNRADGRETSVLRGCQIGKRYPSKEDDFWYSDRPSWCTMEETQNGTWLKHKSMIYCSECCESFDAVFVNDFKFCPNCGANMRG